MQLHLSCIHHRSCSARVFTLEIDSFFNQLFSVSSLFKADLKWLFDRNGFLIASVRVDIIGSGHESTQCIWFFSSRAAHSCSFLLAVLVPVFSVISKRVGGLERGRGWGHSGIVRINAGWKNCCIDFRLSGTDH